ncbi:bifunctional UDP-sugar hydrolase/5'-nucleotidase [Methylococcus sp. EFPC2]|uniref:bifunctional metallophosphatase/5'-nucleotidase n=1 Tax=Methylococcus sp. EFPC2 TaxID=2812648 RepID=UPI001966FD54|nr:bifunctional metallophosphatase/5'-nucleotidase [Methylococcus sp. EFPC2]QSA97102.1 bifunctional metallophosphatase/5'-nucleotidase [Methylococcus sp. EFPC2]
MPKLNRLAAVAVLSSTLAACAAGTRPPTDKPADAHFTLLQVNDTYKIEGLEGGSKGGFARLRTLRKQLEAGGRKVLVLHGGDILFPSVMSKYLRAQPVVKILNGLDGDPAAFDPYLIATFGNHEFDDRDPGVLLGRVAQSDFDWVTANVYYRSIPQAGGEPLSKRLTHVHETLVRELDGVKVGVFGLTTDVNDRDYVRYDYEGDARRVVVRKSLDSLKEQGAQVVIALTHQDLADDEKLAAEFPDIDLIVGGHEHFHIQKRVGRTWITKADADNQSAVVYDVTVRPGQPLEATPRKIDLDAGTEKDAALQAEVEKYRAQLNATVKQQTGRDAGEVVGRAVNLLEGIETAVRGRETALGNFLADTIRTRMKTDVAFTNGGGIRINDNILPGPITSLDLEGLFYFDNQLVAGEVTGAELLDILNNAVSKVHLGDGRFLQVSGLRFEYRNVGNEDAPRFTVAAEDVGIRPQGSRDFRPLDLTRRYTVGTTDFIWDSGYKDGYVLFAKGKGETSPPLIAREPVSFRRAVEEAIGRLPDKTVTTAIEGRIRRVE